MVRKIIATKSLLLAKYRISVSFWWFGKWWILKISPQNSEGRLINCAHNKLSSFLPLNRNRVCECRHKRGSQERSRHILFSIRARWRLLWSTSWIRDARSQTHGPRCQQGHLQTRCWAIRNDPAKLSQGCRDTSTKATRTVKSEHTSSTTRAGQAIWLFTGLPQKPNQQRPTQGTKTRQALVCADQWHVPLYEEELAVSVQWDDKGERSLSGSLSQALRK